MLSPDKRLWSVWEMKRAQKAFWEMQFGFGCVLDPFPQMFRKHFLFPRQLCISLFCNFVTGLIAFCWMWMFVHYSLFAMKMCYGVHFFPIAFVFQNFIHKWDRRCHRESLSDIEYQRTVELMFRWIKLGLVIDLDYSVSLLVLVARGYKTSLNFLPKK